jgi:hypothetical protein
MLVEQFSKLSEKIRGSLITPASGEYEVARKVYNGMIDRRPAAIVRCADAIRGPRTPLVSTTVYDCKPL